MQIEQQIQYQQQLNTKAQDANIALAQQQQAYCYREAMAKELSVPATFALSVALVAGTAFTLISRALKSSERVAMARQQTDLETAKIKPPQTDWSEIEVQLERIADLLEKNLPAD